MKDATGKVAIGNAVKVTVTSESKLGIVTKVNGTSSGVTVAKGTAVTITGEASGGSGNKTYKYVVHNLTNGAWADLTTYVTSANYKYTINSAGTYELYAVVKDTSDKVAIGNAVKVTVN